MPLAQCLLESRVQLIRGKLVPVFEIRLHEIFIDLDHLLDDLSVRVRHARQVDGLVGVGEEAVDHLRAAAGGEIDGKALLSERIAYLRHQRLEVDLRAVDLVHHDHAAQRPARSPLP